MASVKSHKTIVVGALALCTALWSLPLYRVMTFLHELPNLSYGLSVSEANDREYGQKLLISYTLCLLSSFYVGWLSLRSRRIMVLLPCALIIATACWVIHLRPEEVIVFYPSIRPFRPAQAGLFAALIGAYLHLNRKVPME
jgi:hypothetical protein